MAVKLHFTTEYDYFKYHGKAENISSATYEKRTDIKLFEILATKFKRDEILPLLVANFIKNDSLWVGDFLTDFVEVKQNFQRWKSTISRLNYVYEEDLKNVFDFATENDLSSKDLFMYGKKNPHPLIFRFLMENMIHPETFVILDERIGFTHLKFPKDIIFQHEVNKLEKYKTFLPIDYEKFGKRTDYYISKHENK